MHISTYNHFIIELKGMISHLELCSLKVMTHDLGHRLFFTVPEQKSPEQPLYETVQVRFYHSPTPSLWQARKLHIDADGGTYLAGRWIRVVQDDFDVSIIPEPSKWTSPKIKLNEINNSERLYRISPELRFNDDILQYNDYTPSFFWWQDVVFVGMYKKRDLNQDGNKLSLYLNILLTDGSGQSLYLPNGVFTSPVNLYKFLEQYFGIEPRKIDSVLRERRNCALTLWTCLPVLELELPVELDSRVMARDLQTWLLSTHGEPLRMGSLRITGAKVTGNKEPFTTFPPRSIHFHFFGISGKPDKPNVMAAFEDARLAAGEPAFELCPDSTFFEWHGHDLKIFLTYGTGGYGSGYIELSTRAYQSWLHACFPDPGASLPTQFLTPDFIVYKINYWPNDAQRIFPRPDLHNDDHRVIFWRDGTWQGFSAGPWSVRWQSGEITEFGVEVEDECMDRGGPYDYLVIVLADGSRFGIRSKGTIDAGNIRDFLGQ